ncbi:hypothetical protein FACS1894142_7940 [Spirochaetia bacterium]|nr:hypothetical protein FACS1894142_7940 [Spirochaetia bacterium]
MTFQRKPFLIILIGLLALPLCAREVEITVEDGDLGIPLEGALIRALDGAEYECDADGKARLGVPDDRPVVIQAAYPGYENGRLTIPLGQSALTLALRLGGIMENRELVIEAQRPGTSETQSGRSVALSEKEIARTAEIGIIEDVMTSIKLLPGVGYSGMFNAMPSIRGGRSRRPDGVPGRLLPVQPLSLGGRHFHLRPQNDLQRQAFPRGLFHPLRAHHFGPVGSKLKEALGL